MRTRPFLRAALACSVSVSVSLLLFLAPVRAQPSGGSGPLGETEGARVDDAVKAVMQRDRVPALSLAIVRDGRIAYAKAYGSAALSDAKAPTGEGARVATPSTRFAIGSISKEFTAAAILVLVDRGRLSLDDTVAKYLPGLTDAKEVTIRELLSHTSGYRDYFFQEYVPARMQRDTTVDTILENWAKRPLDFAPGESWQYSGTNYVIAGRIIERITGESYESFLLENVLRPVGISDATFVDRPAQPDRDAAGYYRFGLGPARPAPRAGRNWLFAMADLVMTARDVALWDVSVIAENLLSPASYAAMRSVATTRSGGATGYGLGFFIRDVEGRNGRQYLMLHHPGEISGFRSHNFVVPELKAAVVILTNAEFSDASGELADDIQGVIGIAPPAEAGRGAASARPERASSSETPIEARAHRLLQQLASGTIDRGVLSADASDVFTAEALTDIRQSLAPLGRLQGVRVDSTQSRGGTRHYALTVFFERKTLQVAEYDAENGSIEQFFIDE